MTKQIAKKWFPISRWKLTGGLVRVALSHNTQAEAEAKGKLAEVTFCDQVFEGTFYGTWLEFDQLR